MAQWVHHEGSIRRIITSERCYNRATSCSPQKMYTLKTHSGRNHYQDRNPVPSSFVSDDLTTVLPRSIVFISVPIINLRFKHAVLDTPQLSGMSVYDSEFVISERKEGVERPCI